MIKRLNKGAKHNKGTSAGLSHRPRVEDQLLHKINQHAGHTLSL